MLDEHVEKCWTPQKFLAESLEDFLEYSLKKSLGTIYDEFSWILGRSLQSLKELLIIFLFKQAVKPWKHLGEMILRKNLNKSQQKFPKEYLR